MKYVFISSVWAYLFKSICLILKFFEIQYYSVYRIKLLKQWLHETTDIFYEGKINSITAWKVSVFRVIASPYIFVFRLNTEIYCVHFCILSNCGNLRIKSSSKYGYFLHSVFVFSQKFYAWQLDVISFTYRVLLIIY